MQNNTYLELKGISKYFDKVIAVQNFSLKIKKGEFVTLLGPSGSGKTTTLMMIAGFEKANEGQILIESQDLTYVSPDKRDVGMVFQNYALFPHLTIFKNISFPLEMRKIKKSLRRDMVKDILELVGLSGYENRKPKQLSGGQQQRIALARALVFKPKILLMDEPLGALDKNLRQKMQLEIKELQKKLGITTIYVTHDQEEALTMSDTIVVMNEGKIEQVGSPKVIYREPDNLFVSGFLGESNFLNICKVKSEFYLKDTTVPINLNINHNYTKDKLKNEYFLTIRPENIIIVEKNQNLPNELSVEVQNIIYLGDSQKYEVINLDSGQRLVIKEQNPKREVKLGDVIKVGWQTEDSRVLEG